MQYRRLYEDFYGIKIPKGYEVHHIDFNHSNNDPHNLVALPKDLHRRLHKAYYEYNRVKDDYTLNDIKLHSGQITGSLMFMQFLYSYLSVVEECTFYMDKKENAYWRKYYAE